MAELVRFEIAREPAIELSIRGAAQGFGLLTLAQDSQSVTGSPAGLLLTPAQVAAIPPLSTLNPIKDVKVAGLFDNLHEQLTALYASGDFDRLAQQASGFLTQHPIVPMAHRSATEQNIHRFFTFKGKNSTLTERVALYEEISEENRANWLRSAHARIDRQKAQVLATAVSGIAPPRGVDLLGGLKAELAFAVLSACYQSMESKTEHRYFPNKYVDLVLGLSVFLPAIAFEMDVCRSHGSDAPQGGVLHRRLARLRSYEERIKTIAAQTTPHVVLPGEGRGDVAGTPGHADDCQCKCDDPPCMPIDPCCGEINWYVTELLTLKDKNHCYKPSDIAYIENVAPFETRVRKHSFTRTVTETSEEETNTSKEEERDHQVTDRFNLQKEIQNNQKASLDVDAKLSGKIYGQKYELNTKAGLSKESAYRGDFSFSGKTYAKTALARHPLVLPGQKNMIP